MTEWKEYKLGEIATFSQGIQVDINLQSYVKNDEDVRFIRIVDYTKKGEEIPRFIKNPGDKYLVSDSDLVMIRYGSQTAGKIVRGISGAIANNMFKIALNKSIADSIYMYYWLSRPVVLDYFMQSQASSTMPAITFDMLGKMDIYLPPLPEQIRIASILSSLDDKIDLLHRENKTLEAMAETLFRQWFIEEAKEDWEEKHLSDYVIDTLGGDWGKENPEGDFVKPVQCIRGTDIADLNNGLANKTPIRYVKESKYEKIYPKDGDIIMEISGGTENQSTGRVAYINNDVIELFDYPLVFSNFCRLLRMEEKYTYFIYSYLQYLYKQDEFFNLENGSSGIKNLDYKALLYDLTYPMPSENRLIVEYNEKVSLYFRKINKNKKQIQTLTQQRDGLLPKLMSGEVKI